MLAPSPSVSRSPTQPSPNTNITKYAGATPQGDRLRHSEVKTMLDYYLHRATGCVQGAQDTYGGEIHARLSMWMEAVQSPGRRISHRPSPYLTGACHLVHFHKAFMVQKEGLRIRTQHNSKASIHLFIFITVSPALIPSLPPSGQGEAPPGTTLSHQSHAHTLGQFRLTDWCFWTVRGSRSTWIAERARKLPRARGLELATPSLRERANDAATTTVVT